MNSSIGRGRPSEVCSQHAGDVGSETFEREKDLSLVNNLRDLIGVVSDRTDEYFGVAGQVQGVSGLTIEAAELARLIAADLAPLGR